MRRTLTIEYGDDVLLALGLSPEQFSEEAKLLVAVKLYELGRLSSGAAARLAGIPKPLFLTKLADYGVDTFRLTEEELRQDLASVVEELEEGRRRSVPLPTLADLSWLQVRTVRNRTLLPLVTHLGDGEKEVLALGRELSDALLLLDDRDARRHAHALELEISGTLGVLLLAKERGILDAVRPVLDRLQALRFRLDASTRQSVLELAGEVT